MAEDAAFLIDQASSALEAESALPIGWNITLTKPLFARGSDADSIVCELFSRLVPLSQREQGTEKLDGDDHSHATRRVRLAVRDLLKRHMGGQDIPEFWRDKPTIVRRDGHEVQLDLQVVGQAPQRPHFGTVVSAWYKTKFHRNAHLNKGLNAVMAASRLFPAAHNVIYLLSPSSLDEFSSAEAKQLRGDVEGARWLSSNIGATLNEFHSERDIAEQILTDLDALPADAH